MTSATELPAGFERLQQQYPWPASPPVSGAPVVGRESGGFSLVQAALDRIPTAHPVVMEIGSEFGGSTRKFLSRPDTLVVSVDPWPDDYKPASFPELAPFLGGERGMLELFQTFTFDYRDRLVAVREPSPAGPLVVRDAGLTVDLIYIDGDHRYDAVVRDLTIASALFPHAVLAGDDWLLNRGANNRYDGIVLPVQIAVKRWAAVNGVRVEAEGNSWLIDPSQPFNLDRPMPRFGYGAAKHVGVPGNAVLGQRLSAIEASMKRIERSVQNSPSRRVVRTVRALGSKLR